MDKIINELEYILFLCDYNKLNDDDLVFKINNEINKFKETKLEVDFESILSECWDLLRSCLLKTKLLSNISFYRSPTSEVQTIINDTKSADFTYERNISYNELEEKVSRLYKIHDQWTEEHILFSSGMSSIISLLFCFKKMYKTKDKFTLLFWGDYFETKNVMKILSDENFEIIIYEEWSSFYRDILSENYDAIMIEPVKYSVYLDAMNFSELIFALENSKNKNSPKFVILDSTLIANNMPINELLIKVSKFEDFFLININSLLKLHQQGLELTNAGLLSFYSHSSGETFSKNVSKLLKQIRVLNGAGLSLSNAMLLDNGFSFDQFSVNNYAKQIFENNALFAQSLKSGELWSHVSHPVLEVSLKEEWIQSPFVIMQLTENTLEAYEILLTAMKHEIVVRKLNLCYGSSFGFRDSRYEVIFPDFDEKNIFFKVAIGYNKYNTFNMILKLFLEFSELSVSDLKKKCLNLKIVNLKEVFFKS